ncbi:MAG: GAF domain-containing protein [Actinomycetota bacterium]
MNEDQNAPRDPGETLEEALSVVREALEMDVAFVSEFVEDRLTFRALEGDAESFGFDREEGIPLSKSYCKRVIEDRIPRVIPDARSDESVRDLEITGTSGIGAYVGIPLRRSDGSPFGTLCCLSHAPDPWLAERDLKLMENLARHLTRRLEQEGLL